MPIKSGVTIEGIQRAQQKNLRAINAVSAKGKLGKAIKAIMLPAWRYLVQITHVDTGALRASQRMEYKKDGAQAEGTLFVDPKSTNPRSGSKPVEYMVYEERRGGSHASYSRTVDFINKSGLLRHGVTIVREGVS